uniref:GTP cyclohydrolase 1 n=1 Tax=Dunaliella tertiolecta TaxID=3047 RepID=A0A7S3R2M8_DUNTE
MVHAVLACGPGAASAPGKKQVTDEEAKLERLSNAVRTLLLGVGEDIGREGLVDTPKRVAKALMEVSRGYRQVHTSALGEALFHEPIVHEGGQGIVLVRDIEFASTSEETLLPFHGRCHIAYVPTGGTVIGLSKLARLTKLMAKRLLTQERLGIDLTLALQQHMACQGVAVVIVATHLALAGPAPPEEQATVSVSGCFAGEHSTHLMMLMDMLNMPDLPTSAVHLSPCPSNPAPPSRSTASSCGDSVAVDSSDKDCDLSEKDESYDIEERLSSMSTEDGERMGACMEWDGDIAPSSAAAAIAPAKGQQQSSQPGSKCHTSCNFAAMEAAVQSLLAEMGECPSRTGLQGSARRYVATLLASTSGYHRHNHHRADSQRHSSVAPWVHAPHQHQHQEQQQEQQQRTHSSSSCCSDQSQRSLGGGEAAAGTGRLGLSQTHSCMPTAAAAPGEPCHSSQGGHGNEVGAQGVRDVQLSCVVVPFNSQCEHHMLPFYGSATVVFATQQQPCRAQGAGCSSEHGNAGSGAVQAEAGPGCSADAAVSAEMGGASVRGDCGALGQVEQQTHNRAGGSSKVTCVDGGAGVGGRTHRRASVHERQAIESIVSMYTQRLQVQERITHQVADAVAAELDAAAVVVVVDAAHMCMVARGVENHAGRTTTMACRGLACSDVALCHQALLLSRRHGQSRHRR